MAPRWKPGINWAGACSVDCHDRPLEFEQQHCFCKTMDIWKGLNEVQEIVAASPLAVVTQVGINFLGIKVTYKNDCFCPPSLSSTSFSISPGLCKSEHPHKWGKHNQTTAALQNLTLGPVIICIYIESIRFWFIIMAEGGGRTGEHSVTCFIGLVPQWPSETEADW